MHTLDIDFNQGRIRKFIVSINSLNTSSIKAYHKGGFIADAIIKDYFYNKIDNKILLSDKIFVGSKNKNFDMNLIENWNPIL